MLNSNRLVPALGYCDPPSPEATLQALSRLTRSRDFRPGQRMAARTLGTVIDRLRQLEPRPLHIHAHGPHSHGCRRVWFAIHLSSALHAQELLPRLLWVRRQHRRHNLAEQLLRLCMRHPGAYETLHVGAECETGLATMPTRTRSRPGLGVSRRANSTQL